MPLGVGIVAVAGIAVVGIVGIVFFGFGLDYFVFVVEGIGDEE